MPETAVVPAQEDLGFARVDLDRVRRRGYPEAILAAGKTSAEILTIARSLVRSGASNVLVTRASGEELAMLASSFRDAVVVPEAGLCVLNPDRRPGTGSVAVVAHRMEDVPVAEEAAHTAEAMGSAVHRHFDAPFSTPQRLPAWFAGLESPRVIVVAQGGGGALASVIAGLARCVVVAVPTSSGSPLDGLPAMLAALNCCAPGVVVVNVDNGFGAGYTAHLVNTAGERRNWSPASRGECERG
jgi:NCAIR mutase (PurE)-related protein